MSDEMRDRVAAVVFRHRSLGNSPEQTVCACDRTWRENADYRAHLVNALLPLLEITETMIEAAWVAAWKVGIQSPHMARVRDYPDDLPGLQAADREADAQNHEAMRKVLVAALNAATPADRVASD